MNPTGTHPLQPAQPPFQPSADAGPVQPLAAGGELAAWEAMRLGQAVAQRLSQASATLHPDVETRLRFAREQALAHARAATRSAASALPAAGAAGRGSTAWEPSLATGAAGRAGLPAAGGGSDRHRQLWARRLLALLPLLLLVAGLQWVQEVNQRERVLALAELDAELLTNELHPVLYSDPGFAEFLRDGSP